MIFGIPQPIAERLACACLSGAALVCIVMVALYAGNLTRGSR